MLKLSILSPLRRVATVSVIGSNPNEGAPGPSQLGTGDEGTLSYTYYPAGQVETIASSNANGVSVAYTYDGLNRLSTVVDNRLQGSNTTSYTYDNGGWRTLDFPPMRVPHPFHSLIVERVG